MLGSSAKFITPRQKKEPSPGKENINPQWRQNLSHFQRPQTPRVGRKEREIATSASWKSSFALAREEIARIPVGSQLNENQQLQLQNLLYQYLDVFARDSSDL